MNTYGDSFQKMYFTRKNFVDPLKFYIRKEPIKDGVAVRPTFQAIDTQVLQTEGTVSNGPRTLRLKKKELALNQAATKEPASTNNQNPVTFTGYEMDFFAKESLNLAINGAKTKFEEKRKRPKPLSDLREVHLLENQPGQSRKVSMNQDLENEGSLNRKALQMLTPGTKGNSPSGYRANGERKSINLQKIKLEKIMGLDESKQGFMSPISQNSFLPPISSSENNIKSGVKTRKILKNHIVMRSKDRERDNERENKMNNSERSDYNQSRMSGNANENGTEGHIQGDTTERSSHLEKRNDSVPRRTILNNVLPSRLIRKSPSFFEKKNITPKNYGFSPNGLKLRDKEESYGDRLNYQRGSQGNIKEEEEENANRDFIEQTGNEELSHRNREAQSEIQYSQSSLTDSPSKRIGVRAGSLRKLHDYLEHPQEEAKGIYNVVLKPRKSDWGKNVISGENVPDKMKKPKPKMGLLNNIEEEPPVLSFLERKLQTQCGKEGTLEGWEYENESPSGLEEDNNFSSQEEAKEAEADPDSESSQSN